MAAAGCPSPNKHSLAGSSYANHEDEDKLSDVSEKVEDAARGTFKPLDEKNLSMEQTSPSPSGNLGLRRRLSISAPDLSPPKSLSSSGDEFDSEVRFIGDSDARKALDNLTEAQGLYNIWLKIRAGELPFKIVGIAIPLFEMEIPGGASANDIEPTYPAIDTDQLTAKECFLKSLELCEAFKKKLPEAAIASDNPEDIEQTKKLLEETKGLIVEANSYYINGKEKIFKRSHSALT